MSSPNSNSSSKCGTLDAINSTSFDPDQYMHLLVHRSNLEGLLQRHVEMAAEIKNLDTDLQIMKSNIVGMEANMEQLLEKIMSVRSRSAGVNTRLFEKREHATFFVKFWLLAIFVVVFIKALAVMFVGLKTTQTFFKQILHGILHAPMSFFDTSPILEEF
ncbi:vacuolar protein sorting-associated protein 51 homolog [Malus sylvestris]|uniref:vacuolar protein sorting-associated protein 51 homolog n=1 Tax=Malus sylvestris TaxID=3752 RepID=UPI0010AADF79|nr:vacuolar protein sorting-associated protein 51 homolog isoform X1 [Malus domestica]XP_050112133.1 vacuolar protein sorting-associated protein 51 homolog [Malus sylvestris]